MVTTSTHDTKRGEDTSARIAVLSELPELWARAVKRWNQLADPHRSQVDQQAAPNPGIVYLMFQSVVGAIPYGWDGKQDRARLADRLAAYLLKASREAKQETSWTNPNPAYDEAVQAFPRRMFENPRFVEDALSFCRIIEPYGAANSFAQTLLRLVVPGVPDTYQGAELWNQSLVDPDNREPVDYEVRRRLLAKLRAGLADRAALSRQLLLDYKSGALKLYLTHIALTERRARPDLFLRGDYEGLAAFEHVVAFTRMFGKERLICCVPRMSYLLTRGEQPFAVASVWRETKLRVPYAGVYRNALTGAVLTVKGSLRLAEVFADLPVALLFRESEE
jgi:(1->4)-alpha-D-glucan 1-alpha-D-glucosylmutase